MSKHELPCEGELMESHNAAVKAISARLKQLYQTKTPYRIYHGSTNSTRSYQVDRSRMADTSSLDRVIKVDRTRKVAVVEPNVPMDRLVDATLASGLVPPVVMEFPGITVGGGYSGTSGESSSFKYGFFDSTVNWVEFVLPDGEVLTASEAEHADLFRGAAGCFGTLGVATLFELRLIEARTYVELTYHPWDSAARALAATNQAAEERGGGDGSDGAHDYVDGIIFDKRRGVTITGRLTDKIDVSTRVQTFSRRSDPWFYLHAERVTRGAAAGGEAVREAVPLRDYLFRWDRGAFFTGRYAFRYFGTPFNRVTRWALDGFMRTRTMYHALHASGLGAQFIVQDLALPASRAQLFVEWVEERLGIAPLWLCPLQAPRDGKSMHPHARPTGGAKGSGGGGGGDGDKETEAPVEDEPLMNVGVWGPGPTDYKKYVEVNREIEQKVQELGGMKWLYAQAFYTEDEFWQNFDKEWYDGLRKKYRADHLPNIYDKVKVDIEKGGAPRHGPIKRKILSVGQLNGLYGVAHTMFRRDYLLSKK